MAGSSETGIGRPIVMQVLALTRYSTLGSSSRVRFYQYLPYLEASGMEVQVAPLLGNDYVRNLYSGRRQPALPILAAYVRRIAGLLAGRHFDLLWVEKELFPWLPYRLENLLLGRRIPYVVDYDDAVFHRYDRHNSQLIRS